MIKICKTSEISPGHSQVFNTELGEIAVFHTRDDKWIATAAKCPHKEGPIVHSIYGEGKLACPLHGYAYDVVTGECAAPEVEDKLKIYETVVEGSLVSIQ